jgi:hypothetical protein
MALLNIPGGNARAIRMILICAWPAKDGDTTIPRIVDDLSPGAFHCTTYVI